MENKRQNKLWSKWYVKNNIRQENQGHSRKENGIVSFPILLFLLSIKAQKLQDTRNKGICSSETETKYKYSVPLLFFLFSFWLYLLLQLLHFLLSASQVHMEVQVYIPVTVKWLLIRGEINNFWKGSRSWNGEKLPSFLVWIMCDLHISLKAISPLEWKWLRNKIGQYLPD